jgi:hypothetical protein
MSHTDAPRGPAARNVSQINLPSRSVQSRAVAAQLTDSTCDGSRARCGGRHAGAGVAREQAAAQLDAVHAGRGACALQPEDLGYGRAGGRRASARANHEAGAAVLRQEV